MKKPIIPILVIIIGMALIFIGTRREDSVAGVSESIGTSVANTIDGKARQPEHIWYYLGGGVLIFAGVTGALRKRSS